MRVSISVQQALVIFALTSALYIVLCQININNSILHDGFSFILFKVWAEDERELISEGEHECVVVELERFDSRIQQKTNS